MTTKHRNVFAKFSATFAPTQVAAWGQRIREWEADSRKPNPYKEPETSETIHHAQLRLSQDEAAEAEHGQQPLHSKSPSKFLMEALELEEQQRNLKAELSTMKRNTTAKQAADMQSKRNTLFNRIQNFRLVQLVYMPCIAPMLASLTPLASITVATETTQNPSTQALTSNVESTPLLLPSSLTTEQRASISHLAAKEKDLQVAQADDSLAGIRRQRRILYSTYQFKKLNVSGTGNKPNTRVRAVFNRVNERISRLAERYRTAYQALCSLDPRPTSPVTSSDPTMSTWQHRLQPLASNNIRGPGKESDEKNSDYTPSWIWLVPSARPDLTPDESEHEYDDAMRVEWSKTRARLERWEEEHILVQEEMRRTIQFLQWRANWWRAQGEQRLSAPAPLLSGLVSYAAKQAALLEQLKQSSLELWLPAFPKLGLAPDWIQQYLTTLPGAEDVAPTVTPPTAHPTSLNQISTNPAASARFIDEWEDEDTEEETIDEVPPEPSDVRFAMRSDEDDNEGFASDSML
ncbi:hypothetical protein HGRIS_010474 [Hohenbuehelia grisea]|uniref:Uncharacterized protein n=1 Tax=Hohenbuehelia grisea TaxID=104357 RepID=A0ABR3IZL9_9AGAR